MSSKVPLDDAKIKVRETAERVGLRVLQTVRRRPLTAAAAGLAVGVILGISPALRREIVRSAAWLLKV